MENVNGRFHPSNGFRFVYLRGRHGQMIGVITATDDGKMGWSLCNRVDRFSKTEAKEMATNRLTNIPENVVVPDLLRSTRMNMALVSLANSEDVPHTIRHGARETLKKRQETSKWYQKHPGS
jgi:hypothetical protein